MKILMIDDHPSQIHAYKLILALNELDIVIEPTEVYSCEAAYNIISNSKPGDFEIILLDRSMPPFKEKNIMSGEDLAKLIKIRLPESKLVVLTSHAETFIVYNIVKNINPEGLLVKSDFGPDELLYAFGLIIEGGTYYTATVKACIKELLSKDDFLDSYDRQIITLLGRGLKTKSLIKHLSLSRSAIDKRKAQIKIYFGIEKSGDEEIVQKAREAGLI
jgi:two-component system response regulator NreC